MHTPFSTTTSPINSREMVLVQIRAGDRTIRREHQQQHQLAHGSGYGVGGNATELPTASTADQEAAGRTPGPVGAHEKADVEGYLRCH